MTDRDINQRTFHLVGKISSYFFFKMSEMKTDAIKRALMEAYKMGALDTLIEAREAMGKNIYTTPAYKDRK